MPRIRLLRCANSGLCAPGHALPTGRCSSARMGDIAMTYPRQAGHASGSPRIFLRPVRQAPRMERSKICRAAVLGRSHRSKPGKARLKAAIDRPATVLEVPADYLIGIVPASDTGAVEMALWSLLGPAAGAAAGLRKLRQGLGHRRGQAAEAPGRRGAGGALRPPAGPFQGAPRRRPGVHLERHHLRRARARTPTSSPPTARA